MTEFVVGQDPNTTFNRKYFNYTEVGELKADDINFGFSFLIMIGEPGKGKAIDISTIDPRYI